MHHKRWGRKLVSYGILLLAALAFTTKLSADDNYPADYKPSKPEKIEEATVLTRVFAVSTYMTDKIDAAGGKESPICYRNCLTAALNEALQCTESKGTYANSESCERDAAQKMHACDPKCK